MEQYRISKYNPIYRDCTGAYKKNEWTAYSDIGNIYNGERFTTEQYLEIESKYCNAIITILKQQKIKYFQIQDLEMPFTLKEIEKAFCEKGLEITESQKRIVKTIQENQIISIKQIKTYLTMLLRECCWCVLADIEGKSYIDVGYDYYIHLTCKGIDSQMISNLQEQGIYVEQIL